MKQQTIKRVLGSQGYVIYRRIRFLRYRKKQLKKEKKAKRRQEKLQKIRQARLAKANKRSLGERFSRFRRIVSFLYKRSKKVREQRRLIKRQRKEEKRRERLEMKQRVKQVVEKSLEHEKKVERQQKLEKKEIKRERRRIFWSNVRQSFRSAFRWSNIKTLPARALKFAENKEERNNILIILINSTVYFLLAYFLLYLIQQIIVVFTAFQFDYKTILYYFKIYYNIDKYEWIPDSVKILYSIGPLSSAFLGVIAIIYFSNMVRETFIFRLFLLWTFVHGMTLFFGEVLFGALLNKGVGYVITYLYYRDTGKLIFSLVAIFGLVGIGSAVTKSFMLTGNSYFKLLDKGNRRIFMMGQVFFPAIIGMLIIIGVKFPNDMYLVTSDFMAFENLKVLSVLLLLAPVMFSYPAYQELYFEDEEKHVTLEWKPLLILVAFLLLFRFGLSSGIHFG